jgi:hypothetical protein
MKTSANSREIALAQLAGLIAAAWFVWTNTPHSRLLPQLSTALMLSVFAWIASIAITFYILLMVSPDDVKRIRRDALRRSSAGMWFAPAMVLLSVFSPLAIAASLILSMNTARLLAMQFARAHSRPRKHAPSFPAVIGGFTVVAGAAALLWHRPTITAVLLVASAATITALYISESATESRKPVSAPPSAMSIALTILLVMMLSASGIELRHGASDRPRDVPLQTSVTPLTDPNTIGGDSFPGIILHPKAEARKMILTVPRDLPGLLKRDSSIPFTGEYWMYRTQFKRPPRNSFEGEGTPADRLYYTINGEPMDMQAVQPLAAPLDVSCCSAIRIHVRNTDTYPAALAMILMDSSSRREENLGTAIAMGETVTYPLRSPAIQRFDRIRIIYARGYVRIDKSVKLAIVSFDFIR